MSLLRFAWIRIVYSLYFSVSVIFAALAIGAEAGGSYIYYAAFILSAVHFCSYIVAFNSRSSRYFPLIFSICTSIIVVTIIIAGLVIHQDFFRSAFHAAAQLFMLSIYQKENLYRMRTSKEQTRTLYYAALGIVFFGFLWVVMMGMSGVVFNIQSARNWMVFNFYSAGTLILAIDPILLLKEKLFTQLKVTRNAVFIDGKDYSQLLGEKDIAVLRVFLTSPGYQTNCSKILDSLDDAPAGCVECLDNRSKATLCPAYKRLYNQINKIKRFTETMQIATILPPQNKMEITREGWSLHLFGNVKAKI